MTQKYPEKYYDVPSFLPVFCTGKVPLFRFSAFPLFYFSGLSGMPVVQRRTIAACASAQCCSCSRPCRDSSRSSSGVPLALARVSVQSWVHCARASSVSFTEACQASTVFVQSSSVGAPLNFRTVSSQFVSNFCCASAQVFTRLSPVFFSLIDLFSFHGSKIYVPGAGASG